MNKLLFSLVLLSAGFLATAQKTIDDANAEKRAIGSFHGVSVATGIKLILSQGSVEELAVSANKIEYRDKIVTKVENGILKIYYDNKLGAINTRKEKKELKAYVSYKALDELDATTGADVQIEGTLKSVSLKMKINTGGIVRGDVHAEELSVDQSTGGLAYISGEAAKLSYDGNTGALFKGTDLKTNNCTVTASTGAGVYIMVQKELSVKANTGGFVKYKGGAEVMGIKTNLGGSVSKM